MGRGEGRRGREKRRLTGRQTRREKEERHINGRRRRSTRIGMRRRRKEEKGRDRDFSDSFGRRPKRRVVGRWSACP